MQIKPASVGVFGNRCCVMAGHDIVIVPVTGIGGGQGGEKQSWLTVPARSIVIGNSGGGVGVDVDEYTGGCSKVICPYSEAEFIGPRLNTETDNRHSLSTVATSICTKNS